MTDYLERLRTEKMKIGKCELCGTFSDPLERHHVTYSPERTIMLCHSCHWKVTFQAWLLPSSHKEKLEKIRNS